MVIDKFWDYEEIKGLIADPKDINKSLKELDKFIWKEERRNEKKVYGNKETKEWDPVLEEVIDIILWYLARDPRYNWLSWEQKNYIASEYAKSIYNRYTNKSKVNSMKREAEEYFKKLIVSHNNLMKFFNAKDRLEIEHKVNNLEKIVWNDLKNELNNTKKTHWEKVYNFSRNLLERLIETRISRAKKSSLKFDERDTKGILRRNVWLNNLNKFSYEIRNIKKLWPNSYRSYNELLNSIKEDYKEIEESAVKLAEKSEENIKNFENLLNNSSFESNDIEDRIKFREEKIKIRKGKRKEFKGRKSFYEWKIKSAKRHIEAIKRIENWEASKKLNDLRIKEEFHKVEKYKSILYEEVNEISKKEQN